ncbi:MAG: resolvase [Chloroflexi bacterium]|nr:MAG: resolvase [Chloroflexota bacterium]
MTNDTPLCAIYARVSTYDQKCDLQLNECRAYIERRGWKLYGDYVDTGWSGAKKDRPQLANLLKDASLHKFDAVLCWKLDRFGRSVSNFVQNLDNLTAWGVRFIVVTQTIDTDNQNPTSRLIMQVLAAVAEFEREMIRERVKAGMNVAMKRGVHCGRHAIVLDKVKVRELHLRGKTIRQIATELKLTRSVVQRFLKQAA